MTLRWTPDSPDRHSAHIPRLGHLVVSRGVTSSGHLRWGVWVFEARLRQDFDDPEQAKAAAVEAARVAVDRAAKVLGI